MKSVNPKASPFAQVMFDKLHKTMPCEWASDERGIVVLNQVRIDPPYTADACQLVGGPNADAASLARIRRVVEGVGQGLGNLRK